jgi:hypothetical protein
MASGNTKLQTGPRFEGVSASDAAYISAGPYSKDLLRYGRITTTMARAKALRKPVEHMIQLGKDGGNDVSEHKKRQAEVRPRSCYCCQVPRRKPGASIHAEASLSHGGLDESPLPPCTRGSVFHSLGGQGESLVPPYIRVSVSLTHRPTGARAKVWCLLIHARKRLSRSVRLAFWFDRLSAFFCCGIR